MTSTPDEFCISIDEWSRTPKEARELIKENYHSQCITQRYNDGKRKIVCILFVRKK